MGTCAVTTSSGVRVLARGVLVWVCRIRGPSAAATAGSEVGAPVCGAGACLEGGRGAVCSRASGWGCGGYFSYYRIQNSISSYYRKET